MKLTWLGHSCYFIETADGSVVFDPFADDYVPGYSRIRVTADAVYCSHDHRDHNASSCVTLSGKPFAGSMETVDVFHDEKQGALRGKNRIHILHAEGMRVAHLGDLGHMLSGEALDAIRGADILLIPVGGHYTIDSATAKKLADTSGARVVFPMHYRLGNQGYKVLSELDAYTSLCGNVTHYPGHSAEVTPDTPAQTAVLTYEHT